MKIRLMGAELFHADGRTQTDRQTDTTRLIVAFRTFANAPKNWIRWLGLLFVCLRINSISWHFRNSDAPL